MEGEDEGRGKVAGPFWYGDGSSSFWFGGEERGPEKDSKASSRSVKICKLGLETGSGISSGMVETFRDAVFLREKKEWIGRKFECFLDF